MLASLFVALLLPGEARSQSRFTFGRVVFPAAIDTFVCQSAYRWPEEPRLGTSLTYVIPGDRQTELTVYVYSAEEDDSGAARGDPRAERDRAASEIKAYAVRNRQLDEFRVDSQGVHALVLPDGRTVEGAYAAFLFRRGESRLTSLLYVFVGGRRYIKFRITLAAAVVPALAPHLAAFMAAALIEIRELEHGG